MVRDGFEKTNLPRMSSDRAGEVRNYIAYLQELLNAAARGHYLGLTAMMKEIFGRALNRACQEENGGYELAAGQNLERQADSEQE